jgi:hypothetical protein
MRHHAIRTTLQLASAAILMATLAAGCVMTTHSGSALAAGTQASIQGRISSIDTAPWTYDGNAVVGVATRAHGVVAVHLPARWNLCRAQPVDMQALAIGDDVHATGSVGTTGELVVCEQSGHGLRKVD